LGREMNEKGTGRGILVNDSVRGLMISIWVLVLEAARG
jgi:hypothetical protein